MNSKNEHAYTIQYEIDTIKNYLEYREKFASDLQNNHNSKFKNKFLAERHLFIRLKDLD